jgi:acyl-CoA thioesterase
MPASDRSVTSDRASDPASIDQAEGEYAFMQDTAVSARAENVYDAHVTDRWSIGGRPNGGYLVGIVLTAIGKSIAHPDPLTSTAHFLSPAEPGPARVSVDVVKRGRSVSTAQAVLRQGERDRLLVLSTFGDLDSAQGHTRILEDKPDPGPQLISSQGRAIPFPIVERFEFLLPPEQALAAAGQPTSTDGPAEFFGRIRFADDMPANMYSLPLLVDAFPPAVFNLGLFGWTPTLELTVHGRGRPVPGWLTLRVKTHYLINGFMEEDGELWDETESLVAQSRQLARVLV